jgi:tetratricopeptide (TPR) repeat protein
MCKEKYSKLYSCKMIRNLLLALLIIAAINTNSIACSVVKVAKDGKVLVGNNEDMGDTRTKMWFVPQTEKEYGRICFGSEKYEGFVQGGMNEKGLMLDALATKPNGWKADPNKPDFDGQINDYILAKFAAVEEVKSFFHEYNVFLGGGVYMIADESGQSMIVEYAEGDYRFVESDKYFQIATNFIQYGKKEDEKTDYRYNVARKILEHENEASIDVVRKVLSSIHSERALNITHNYWISPTVYSYICDLKSKTILVYNFHNFEEVYEIDLAQELEKGKHYYNLPDLFSIKTFAAFKFDQITPQNGVEELGKMIEVNGIEQAKKWFKNVNNELINVYKYRFEEYSLILLGYDFMQTEDVGTAIEIFKIATEAHPNAYNTWDSLAEAYMESGENETAILYYEKSLEINPDNENAKKQIKKMKSK